MVFQNSLLMWSSIYRYPKRSVAPRIGEKKQFCHLGQSENLALAEYAFAKEDHATAEKILNELANRTCRKTLISKLLNSTVSQNLGVPIISTEVVKARRHHRLRWE